MQCQYAQDRFSDFITEQLDTAQKVSVENHLAACPDCREQLSGLRSMWSSLETLPVVELPEYFHANVMSRIATEAAKEAEAKAIRSAVWDWRTLFRPKQLAFGAAALMILLAGLEGVQTIRGSIGPVTALVRLFFPSPAPPAAPLTLQAQQATWTPNAESGGTLTLTLRAAPKPDGSENALNFKVMQAGNPEALKSGVVSSQRDTTVHISMAEPPAPESLSLTLSDQDATPHTATQNLTVSLPNSSTP